MQAYERLEHEWARFNDLDPLGMVACSSGTAALHLALEALQLPPQSKVIVPDFTMVACARAVTLAGLEPVFVDCDERLLMNFALVPPAGTFKALMVVHIYGRRWPVEYLSPNEVFFVIEDLAEMHGVRPSNRTNAACWSFYKNKIVAGEEGGAVWFRNNNHARIARSLRTLGFTEAHDYTHRPRGHNYRMSDVHAELIMNKYSGLRYYENNLRRRRELEVIYDRECPYGWKMPHRDAPWVYDIRIPGLSWIKQTEIVIALCQAGIAARYAFKPMHLQEEYNACECVGGDVARRASQEVIYLPLGPLDKYGEQSVLTAFRIIRECLST